MPAPKKKRPTKARAQKALEEIVRAVSAWNTGYAPHPPFAEWYEDGAEDVIDILKRHGFEPDPGPQPNPANGQLAAAAAKEQAEHPWATAEQARRIASDHLAKQKRTLRRIGL